MWIIAVRRPGPDGVKTTEKVLPEEPGMEKSAPLAPVMEAPVTVRPSTRAPVASVASLRSVSVNVCVAECAPAASVPKSVPSVVLVVVTPGTMATVLPLMPSEGE